VPVTRTSHTQMQDPAVFDVQIFWTPNSLACPHPHGARELPYMRCSPQRVAMASQNRVESHNDPRGMAGAHLRTGANVPSTIPGGVGSLMEAVSSTMTQKTFIIDCHRCRAKVAALESGRAERTGLEEESSEPWGERVLVGTCPSCHSILVGHSTQRSFAGFDAEEDRWSDAARVFPKPSKAFLSYRIPRVVTDSLLDADRSLQANANIAACVMLGRALEAMCHDVLENQKKVETEKPATESPAPQKAKRYLTLSEGIERLRANKVIDDRLYDWSQQLRAFRNIAAHAQDVAISREDAEDLQTFVYAIIEYVYDLADRYEEFKARRKARSKVTPQVSLI
jgi:hypothetical protein